MFWVKKMHFKILKGYSQLQNPVTKQHLNPILASLNNLA